MLISKHNCTHSSSRPGGKLGCIWNIYLLNSSSIDRHNRLSLTAFQTHNKTDILLNLGLSQIAQVQLESGNDRKGRAWKAKLLFKRIQGNP